MSTPAADPLQRVLADLTRQVRALDAEVVRLREELGMAYLRVETLEIRTETAHARCTELEQMVEELEDQL